MVKLNMIGNEIVYEKIKNFYRLQCKVHLSKLPTPKFPNGKFHNGFIVQVYNDKISFLDDVEKEVMIYFFEVSDIEEFKGANNG